MCPARRRIEQLLQRFAGRCCELHEHRGRQWQFLRHEDVEPINNASEHALRHAAIWPKLSLGTQSAAGIRFVETMLTVVETCRQQRRSVFECLAHALEAQANGPEKIVTIPRDMNGYQVLPNISQTNATNRDLPVSELIFTPTFWPILLIVDEVHITAHNRRSRHCQLREWQHCRLFPTGPAWAIQSVWESRSASEFHRQSRRGTRQSNTGNCSLR